MPSSSCIYDTTLHAIQPTVTHEKIAPYKTSRSSLQELPYFYCISPCSPSTTNSL